MQAYVVVWKTCFTAAERSPVPSWPNHPTHLLQPWIVRAPVGCLITVYLVGLVVVVCGQATEKAQPTQAAAAAVVLLSNTHRSTPLVAR